jgi:hypothetical protein
MSGISGGFGQQIPMRCRDNGIENRLTKIKHPGPTDRSSG